jgi:hypothetical protein
MNDMKSNSSLNVLWIITIVCGFVTTAMLFLPAVVFRETSNTYTGLQVSFGYQFSSLGQWASGDIKFSLFNLIAYLLPSFGPLDLLLRKKGYYFATFAALISVILLFLVPFFTVVTVTVLESVKTVNIDWNYGIGLKVAIFTSIASFLVSLYVITSRGTKGK